MRAHTGTGRAGLILGPTGSRPCRERWLWTVGWREDGGRAVWKVWLPGCYATSLRKREQTQAGWVKTHTSVPLGPAELQLISWWQRKWPGWQGWRDRCQELTRAWKGALQRAVSSSWEPDQLLRGPGREGPGTPGEGPGLRLKGWRAASKPSIGEGPGGPFLRGSSPPSRLGWGMMARLRESHLVWQKCLSGSQACVVDTGPPSPPRSGHMKGQLLLFHLRTSPKMWDFCPVLASESHKRNAFTWDISQHVQMCIKS